MENAVVIGGTGTVGKATMKSFGIENQYSRSYSNITLNEIAKLKYIFICLPTPTIDGECFTKDITEFIRVIESIERNDDRIYIMRSTVSPGYAVKLQLSMAVKIVSNPEFLSEDTWELDAKQPTIAIIGCTEPKYSRIIEAIYKARFKYLTPIITDNTTAELIKLTLNIFFSLKVIYGNEIYDYARRVGANYETVKKALEGHEWGSKNHFTPVYKGSRGLKGKCLPKDLEAFMNETNSDLLKTVFNLSKGYEK